MHTSIFSRVFGLFAPADDGTSKSGGGGGGDVIDPGTRVGIDLSAPPTAPPATIETTPKVEDPPAKIELSPEAAEAKRVQDEATAKAAALAGGKKEDPPAKKPDENAPPAWTVEKFLESIGMKDLKEGDKRLADFKNLRELVGSALKVNQEQSLKLQTFETEKATLTKDLEEAKKAAANGTGAPADVVKIQGELKALQEKHTTELAEWNEEKAKKALTNNEAFKAEFDGKKARLFNSAKEAAAEAGLDAAKLDGIFEMKSELQIRKAIDALELNDPTTETMLLEKALGHLDLDKQREAILTGKNGKKPSESAAEWMAYEANLGGAITRQFTDTLRGQILQDVDVVKAALAEKSGVFKTAHGDTVMEEIRQRFSTGFDLNHKEVIESMALARVAPIYEKLAVETAEKLRIAEAQIAELTKQGPGSVTRTPFSGGGGGGGSGSPQGGDAFSTRTGIDMPAKA